MKVNIELKHVAGPYSDCTSVYDVSFPEGITVLDFVKHIVKDRSINSGDNWGAFIMCGDEYKYKSERFLHYNRGKAFYEEPWVTKERGECIFNSVRDKKITKIRAYGGWSNMDYHIYTEADDEHL